MSIVAWLERLKRRRLDHEDFDDEIRAHLAMAENERIADGADRQTAHYAALKEFGNVTLTTEAARRVWTPWWLEALHNHASDVRYAIRALARNPTFSLTVVGVLTLGIGLNAAVFTMLKGIVLSPLAGVNGSARLAVVFRETTTGRQLRVSYPDYQDLRDRDRVFSELMGSTVITAGLGRGRSSRPVWGELVTGNYFQVLGVPAARGRTLLPSDEIVPGGHPVIVLSDGLWRRDFGGDPDIVGKVVEINHQALTVVGVSDPTFRGTIVGYDIDVFIPVMMAPQLGFTFGSQETTPSVVLADRRAGVLFPHGRLQPGTTLARAAAESDALWASLVGDRPPTEAGERLKLVRFAQSPTGGQVYLLPSLIVLSAMGLLVLLIACANIAGLVLVRGLSRSSEIALRLALGASGLSVVRGFLAGGLRLGAIGAALGVVAALGVSRLLGSVLFGVSTTDGISFARALTIVLGGVVVATIVPAWRAARTNPLSALRQQ